MFEIAVIGAGPGGLSAAARCAESGIDHVLLESSPKVANTIQKYQKGKHVMAEPGVLPLRSPIVFDAGKATFPLKPAELCTMYHPPPIHYGPPYLLDVGRRGRARAICITKAEDELLRVTTEHVVQKVQ